MSSPSRGETEQELKLLDSSGLFSEQEMRYLLGIHRHSGKKARELSKLLNIWPESQIRKLASFARKTLPAYYSNDGRRNAVYIEHSARGYKLTARWNNALANLTLEDQEAFNQSNALKEILTAPKLNAALLLLNDLRARYPRFAPINANLAEVYGLLGMHCIVPPGEAFPLCEKHAKEAIASDPNLWSAYSALSVANVARWRWTEAKEALDKAEALSPFACLHFAHPVYHAPMRELGAFITRLEREERNIEFRPLALRIKGTLCLAYILDGQYDRAIKAIDGLLQIYPHYHLPHVFMAIAYTGLAMNDKALHHLNEANALEGGQYFTPGLRVFCLGRLGREAEALAELEKLKHREPSRYVATHQFACAYAGLGDTENMFECLDESLKEGDIQATVLHAWPYFRDYHSNERFREYFKRMNLADIK